jgi:hypothetical protein
MMGFQIGHYLSVKIGEPQVSSGFTDFFWDQIAAFQRIEDKDKENVEVDTQVTFRLSTKFQRISNLFYFIFLKSKRNGEAISGWYSGRMILGGNHCPLRTLDRFWQLLWSCGLWT